MNLQRMIRKDGFKLLVYPKIKKVLLFDLQNDPNEMNDLSETMEYASKVESLFSDLIELQKEMDDPLSLKELYDEVIQK